MSGKGILQAELKEMNIRGIIGLEYIIEVHMGGNFESIFHCVLCEGQFDLKVVIAHLTTYIHRLKYLVCLCLYLPIVLIFLLLLRLVFKKKIFYYLVSKVKSMAPQSIFVRILLPCTL